LFDGIISGNGITNGFSFAYKGACGRYPFKVSGLSSSDNKTIRLWGTLPSADRRCNINGGQNVQLDFDVLFPGSQY
jgi:hypothetical protein